MTTTTLDGRQVSGLTWSNFGITLWGWAPQRTGRFKDTDRISSSAAPAEAESVVISSDATSATNAILDGFLARVRAELDRYEDYGRAWDGYDAEPFEPRLLQKAHLLTEALLAQLRRVGEAPDLFTTGPAPDGSIDLELRRRQRRLFVTLYPTQPTLEVATLEGEEPTVLEPRGGNLLEGWVSWLVS